MSTSFRIILSCLVSVVLLGKVVANEIAPIEGLLAPDFELVQEDGTNFKLSDYRGKQAVYVVFWNTWCHFCMRKIPKLKDAELNLSEQIKIIAINTSREDSIEKMSEFKKQFAINYSLVFDHNSNVSDLYKVGGVPTEFIVDINGIIKHRDGVPKKLQPSLALWNSRLEDKCNNAEVLPC